MKNILNLKKVILMISFLFCSVGVSFGGAKAKFLLTPMTPTHVKMTTDQTATIQYTVVNQTNLTRTLTIKPIAHDVTQIVTGKNVCSHPFTLAPHASCLLTLKVNSGTTPSHIIGGPVVCKTQSATDNTPDLFLCSEPSIINRLDIVREPPSRVEQLTISPPTLTLIAGSPFTPGTIRVTNNSAILTATHVAANFTGTLLAGNVTQDASQCVSLPPKQSCALTFTPLNNGVTLTSFPIQGSNTVAAGASMEVLSQLALTVTGSPLTLNPSSGGTLIVRNTSTNITANNIIATLPSSLIAAGVTVSACFPSQVPPGQTCTLTFTSSNTGASSAMVTIQGTNTDLTSAFVSVNTPAASLSVNSSVTSGSPSIGSPMTLLANGSVGTMTITNTGNVTVNNVEAALVGTPLNGYVTATPASNCSSLAPQGTCVITFTSNYQIASTTTFQITSTGSNSASVNATLTINGLPMAYLSSPASTPEIVLCMLDPTNGNPTSCQNSGAPSNILNNPRGMSLVNVNSNTAYLYVANIGANQVTQCTVDRNTGALTLCAMLGDPSFYVISDVTIYNNNAYVVNAGNNTISICPIVSGGTFGGSSNPCTVSASGSIDSPQTIAFSPILAMTYIANDSFLSLTQCGIGNNGILTNCINPSPVTSPTVIGLAVNPTGTFLYLSYAGEGSFISCPLNQTTGDVGGCSSASTFSMNNVSSVAISSHGQNIYAVGGSNLLIQCLLNTPDNGEINASSCSDNYSSIIPSPEYGIALMND